MPIMGSLSFVLYGLASMGGAYFMILGIITVGNIAAFSVYPTRRYKFQQLNMLFSIAGEADLYCSDQRRKMQAKSDWFDCSGRGGLCWAVPTEDGLFIRSCGAIV